MKNESFKELVEVEFVKVATRVEHTTSKNCSDAEKSEVKDEDGLLKPLRVSYNSRSWPNRFLFVVYKLIRIYYVSLYYYFLPFSAIIISTLVPISFRTYILGSDNSL